VDLARLLAASGAGGVAELGRLPLSETLAMRAGESRARELALTGGDDYELCFSVPTGQESALLAQAAGWPCEVTQIGRVVAEPGLRWYEDDLEIPVPATSFRHF
jgi:thiamine-monophosphate kinase